MADGPVTLRMGSAGVPAVDRSTIQGSFEVPSQPISGTRKKNTSNMTRGQKAAATRAKNKRAAERGTSPQKRSTTVRRPKNWDSMTRGEKIAYTRKANARAAARSEKSGSNVKEKTSRKGKRRGRKKNNGLGNDVPKLSLDGAKKRLEQIRAEDPRLAEAIEEEIEARARREKIQGDRPNAKRNKTAIIASLAENHETSAGEIVRPGSALGYALDGAIVVGSGLISNRLDEMISARPLGLAPSDIILIVETLVLAVGMWKKNRKVVRYSSLALTGTAGAKLIRRASGGRSTPSP